MSGSGLSPRQLALGRASAEQVARSRAGSPDSRSAGPQPGDRFLLRATADLPVEWILLERHAERPAFLAVPADTHPLVASTDLELPPDSDAGTLRLRCGFSTWLEAGQLTLHAGAIDRGSLAAARARVRELRSSVSRPEAPGAVEASAEYRSWIREAIAPALAAVEAPATKPQGARPRPWRQYRTPLAWAAALSLLLAGALAGWWVRGGERGQGAGEAEERARLVRRLATQEGQGALLRQRIAELEQKAAAALGSRVNIPVAVLYPADPLRDAPEANRIPARAPHLVAVLVRDEAEDYPAYRVLLHRQGSAAPVWQSDGLERLDRGVNVELPRDLLPPGIYRFHLSGLRGSRAHPLADYELVIAR